MKKACLLLVVLLALLVILPLPVLSANATTSVRVVKYAVDGSVMAETTKSYQWLEKNLPVQGDGVTHYYHQGPIFEGDMWDPSETLNLKDKGAVKGTALKDLCELVGGLSPDNEIMVKAVDGWHTEFGYANIYEPKDIQGPITLCWYCGEDALDGERYGTGYPGGYYTAMQLNILAGTANSEGKYVFGNQDMKECFTDAKYQHFFEGLASTNGLSGKWISEVAVYSGEAPVTPGEKLPPETPSPAAEESAFPLVPVIIGAAGVIIVCAAVIYLYWRKTR